MDSGSRPIANIPSAPTSTTSATWRPRPSRASRSIKIFFQPNVNIDLAIAQIVSASNAIRALMPAGIQPPVIVQYNASSVPVLQLSLSSDRLNEQQLYDYGIYRLRQALAPIQGITLPTPYGGKYRQIMVDLDPAALQANGITPDRRRQCRQRPEPDPALGRRQDGRPAIYRAPSTPPRRRSAPSIRCRSSRSARTTISPARRGACARRLGRSAEHRARRWPAGGAADDHQERRRLDPRCGQPGQGGDAGYPGGGTARA